MTSPITPAGTVGAPATATPDQQKKLKSAAEAFEAVMVRQMLGAMRSANLGDGIFDSSATDQFRDMADAKTADAMAHKGVFGIAELLMKQYGATAAPGVAQAGTAGAAKAEPK